MKISSKSLLVIALSFTLSALANYAVLKTSVFPTFITLERDAAMRNLSRATQAIESEIQELSNAVWDYSNWDDSYAYVIKKDKRYPKVNLAPESMTKLGVDMVEIFDLRRKLIYSQQFDKGNAELNKPKWSLLSLCGEECVFSDAGATTDVSGLIKTPEGIAVFASRPVLKTTGEGPAVGTYIFLRFLDDELIDKLKKKLKIDFQLIDLDSSGQQISEEITKQILRSPEAVIIKDSNSGELDSFASIGDYRKTPIIIVRSRTAGDISAVGQRALVVSVAGLAVAGLVVMAVTAAFLQWLLVGPLVKLTGHVVSIGADASLTRHMTFNRRDEIGILSREFDKMLTRLAETRRRLLEQSFNAGIAEMASGVLHNLRNQLTPVSMRIGRLRDRVALSPSDRMLAALREVADESTRPERRDKLLRYLDLSLRDAAVREADITEQIDTLCDGLLAVSTTLTGLDSVSHVDTKIEAVDLQDVIKETLSILPQFPNANVRIEVSHAVAQQAPVLSASFVLKHVLHNLMVNSMEAISASGRSEGRILVTAERTTCDGKPSVDLQIVDDGVGIVPEQLQDMFRRGFTTKKGGSRGTGLHWCANSVAAMGGRLYAQSAGPGCGATLHVLLPECPHRLATDEATRETPYLARASTGGTAVGRTAASGENAA